MTELRRPSRAELPDYVAALERGWSPDNVRGAAAAAEQLAGIAADADGFLDAMDDPAAAKRPMIILPDGSQTMRLPSITRWIWDKGFCGSIGLRWPADLGAPPPHVPGHIGYAVVPWRRREGHATRALGLILGEARRIGLPAVEITTDIDNRPSQRVIEENGGVLLGRRRSHPAYAHGDDEHLLWRIVLAER